MSSVLAGTCFMTRFARGDSGRRRRALAVSSPGIIWSSGLTVTGLSQAAAPAERSATNCTLLAPAADHIPGMHSVCQPDR
jgi:hypothetical protein